MRPNRINPTLKKQMNMEQNLKKIMIALIVVVVALAGVLAYVWYQKSSLVKELTIEKDELTEQMVALQNDYAILHALRCSFSSRNSPRQRLQTEARSVSTRRNWEPSEAL